MDTNRQWYVFCACILIGVIGGVVYDVCSLVVFQGKNKKIYGTFRLIADVVFFLLFAVLCVFLGNRLGFAGVREYYFIGYAIGLALYLKTFHKAVAFLKNICYNGVKKVMEWLKRAKKLSKRKEKSV